MEDGRYLKIGPLASQIRLLISELGLLISHFIYDLEDIFLTALDVESCRATDAAVEASDAARKIVLLVFEFAQFSSVGLVVVVIVVAVIVVVVDVLFMADVLVQWACWSLVVVLMAVVVVVCRRCGCGRSGRGGCGCGCRRSHHVWRVHGTMVVGLDHLRSVLAGARHSMPRSSLLGGKQAARPISMQGVPVIVTVVGVPRYR